MRFAPNPSSDAKRGIEVTIDSIPIGGRFRLNHLPGLQSPADNKFGTMVEHGVGRCVVRIDKPKKHVNIRTGSGDAVEFESDRNKVTSYASDTAVEFLGEIVADILQETEDMRKKNSTKAAAKGERKRQTPKGNAKMDKINAASRSRKGRTLTEAPEAALPADMPDTPNPEVTIAGADDDTAVGTAVASDAPTPDPTPRTPSRPPVALTLPQKALVARWKLGVQRLSDLLKVDVAVGVMSDHRDKLGALYAEAIATATPLPHPAAVWAASGTTPAGLSGMDPAFDEMEFDIADDQVSSQNDNHNPTTEESTDMASKKKTAATKAAKSKSTKPHTPKSSKKENPCLDGCGKLVGGRFAQGHDAKYRGLILKVERGEMKQSELPDVMRKQGGKNGEALEFRKVADGLKCVNSVLAH